MVSKSCIRIVSKLSFVVKICNIAINCVEESDFLFLRKIWEKKTKTRKYVFLPYLITQASKHKYNTISSRREIIYCWARGCSIAANMLSISGIGNILITFYRFSLRSSEYFFIDHGRSYRNSSRWKDLWLSWCRFYFAVT